MPIYNYKARNRADRKVVTGTIEAVNPNEAIKKLRSQGLLILSVNSNHNITINLPILHRVSNKDRILFAREFAVMMRAGLPILDALRAIEDQTSNKTFKKTIVAVTKDIEGGTSLSEAFKRYPAIFPPIFISVSRIGEKSGKLEEVLERLATQLEKDDDLISKIRGAMIYPIFVLSALVCVVIVILVYIIPQLKGLFDDASIQMPAITRALLALSEFVRHYLLVFGGVIAVALISIRLANRHIIKARLATERFRMHIPIFGKLYKQMVMARFSHTLATLLGAGLPMIEAIKTTSSVINSPNYSVSLEAITHDMESGRTLSQGLLAHKDFPTMVGHMVAIGEKSGNIDSTLETVAGFFDKEVEGITRNLSALLEPILMLVMGLGVGLVVASVIVPIYNLVNAV